MDRWSSETDVGDRRIRSRGLRRQAKGDILKKRLVALEAVSARHSAHITIMWQAPSLAVAAEAFLLTIALSAQSSTTSRIAVSVLGITIATLASHFMAKHRLASVRDGQILSDLIKKLDMADVFDVADRVKSTWLSRRSSYLTWRVGLVFFIIVNAAVLVVSIVHPEAFAAPPTCPRTQTL